MIIFVIFLLNTSQESSPGGIAKLQYCTAGAHFLTSRIAMDRSLVSSPKVVLDVYGSSAVIVEVCM